MTPTDEDAPTTEETAEMVELEKMVRAKDHKPKTGEQANPRDDRKTD